MKYIHKETGKLYEVIEPSRTISTVKDKAIDVIIYTDDSGELYVRDKQMFEKKFRPVTCEDCVHYAKYVNVDSLFICNRLKDERKAEALSTEVMLDLCDYFQPCQPEPEDE